MAAIVARPGDSSEAGSAESCTAELAPAAGDAAAGSAAAAAASAPAGTAAESEAAAGDTADGRLPFDCDCLRSCAPAASLYIRSAPDAPACRTMLDRMLEGVSEQAKQQQHRTEWLTIDSGSSVVPSRFFGVSNSATRP